MNDIDHILIQHDHLFPDDSFEPAARKAWEAFLEIVQSDHNIAFWYIDGYSYTVRLTGRNIDEDETCESYGITVPIIIVLNESFESMNPEEVLPSEDRIEEFENWVSISILKSFNSKKIQKLFGQSGLLDNDFAIVVSSTDEGIIHDEINVIWTNDDQVTESTIQKRARNARKK